MGIKEAILQGLKDFNNEYNEPAFMRQLFIHDPETKELYTDGQLTYYLTRLAKEGKVERIPTPNDAYRYLAK